MKKTKYLVLLILLIISFVGCSNSNKNDNNTTALSTTEKSTQSTTVVSTTEEHTKSTTAASTTISRPKTTVTKKVQKPSSQKTTKKATTTKKPQNSTKKTSTIPNHDHSELNGNMGKWFNSRAEVNNYYNRVVNNWNTKEQNGEITWKEYVKSCPNGYECWSCPYCHKWTGNFYYNTKKWCTEGGDDHWLYNDRVGWYSTYNDAKNAGDKYMETHNDVSGYTVQQCDCGMYTASFYN